MKKLLWRSALTLGTLGVIVGGAAAFSAFEAHIVNVTAHIENALLVPVEADGLTFGTVFPQEQLDQFVDLGFSSSFQGQTRVNGVDYILRQKPKCVDDRDPSVHPQVTEVTQADGTIVFACPVGSTEMPLLCPYLSKHELTPDPVNENDPLPNILAFHGPLKNWTLNDTVVNQAKGRLDQLVGDTQDRWDIDLKAPCFAGQCSQDWAHFVTSINPTAVPNDYIQPSNLEGSNYGCDLWFEVTGVNTPTPPGN